MRGRSTAYSKFILTSIRKLSSNETLHSQNMHGIWSRAEENVSFFHLNFNSKIKPEMTQDCYVKTYTFNGLTALPLIKKN